MNCCAAALHAALNAFLVYKGAKERATAAEDATYSTLVSAGGFFAAHTTDAIVVHLFLFAGLEKAVAIRSGPVGAALILGVGMGARGFLRRIAERRHIADRIAAGSAVLNGLVQRLAAMDDTASLPASA